jgi:hypothetical protein
MFGAPAYCPVSGVRQRLRAASNVVSAKAVAAEIERVVVGGGGVLYVQRFFDEFVPI